MTDVMALTNMVYVKPPKYTCKCADWLDWQIRMFCCLAQNECGKALNEQTILMQVMTIIERATFETSKTCVLIHGADEVPKRCDPLHGDKINRGMIE
jgi:hypothetical protein